MNYKTRFARVRWGAEFCEKIFIFIHVENIAILQTCLLITVPSSILCVKHEVQLPVTDTTGAGGDASAEAAG